MSNLPSFFRTSPLRRTMFDGLDIFDSIFDNSFHRIGIGTEYNYIVDGKTHRIEIPYPGYTKDDIKISSDNGKLIIEAESKDEKDRLDTSYYGIRSRKYNCFEIGDLDSDTIKAKLENGILQIVIQEKEKHQNLIEIT